MFYKRVVRQFRGHSCTATIVLLQNFTAKYKWSSAFRNIPCPWQYFVSTYFCDILLPNRNGNSYFSVRYLVHSRQDVFSTAATFCCETEVKTYIFVVPCPLSAEFRIYCRWLPQKWSSTFCSRLYLVHSRQYFVCTYCLRYFTVN